MDPALQLVLRSVLTLLFASAARHKIGDAARFRAVVAGYDLVPAALVRAAAVVVTLAEIAVATMIAGGVALGAAGGAGACLLLLYAAAIAVNVRRGRVDIDCGCMGPAAAVPLGSALAVRNSLLAAACLLLLVPIVPRAFTTLDVFCIVASTTALTAAWMASQRVLALAPRVAAARRRSG